MPLDSIDSNKYFYLNRNLSTELKFAWLPRKCNISGKNIWLQYGYKLTAIWTGPGDSVSETKWHDKNEHIIWSLKR